jgi:hypothetical protein
MMDAETRADIGNLGRNVRALSERVDYLHVAVMRGDPRFTKLEYANPEFDGAAFDADCLRRGKRVPDMAEVFGYGR